MLTGAVVAFGATVDLAFFTCFLVVLDAVEVVAGAAVDCAFLAAGAAIRKGTAITVNRVELISLFILVSFLTNLMSGVGYLLTGAVVAFGATVDLAFFACFLAVLDAVEVVAGAAVDCAFLAAGAAIRKGTAITVNRVELISLFILVSPLT